MLLRCGAQIFLHGMSVVGTKWVRAAASCERQSGSMEVRWGKPRSRTGASIARERHLVESALAVRCWIHVQSATRGQQSVSLSAVATTRRDAAATRKLPPPLSPPYIPTPTRTAPTRHSRHFLRRRVRKTQRRGGRLIPSLRSPTMNLTKTWKLHPRVQPPRPSQGPTQQGLRNRSGCQSLKRGRIISCGCGWPAPIS